MPRPGDLYPPVGASFDAMLRAAVQAELTDPAARALFDPARPCGEYDDSEDFYGWARDVEREGAL